MYHCIILLLYKIIMHIHNILIILKMPSWDVETHLFKKKTRRIYKCEKYLHSESKVGLATLLNKHIHMNIVWKRNVVIYLRQIIKSRDLHMFIQISFYPNDSDFSLIETLLIVDMCFWFFYKDNECFIVLLQLSRSLVIECSIFFNEEQMV